MDLFTYLMAKNGNNTSVHGDLFSYLLGKGQSHTQTISGVTIYIPNAKKLVSFMMTKESTQDGEPTPDNPQEVKTVKGYRNLFDKDSALIGYALNRNTNVITELSNYITSDYCDVMPNTKYRLNMTVYTSNNYGIVYYDENKNRLSSIAPSTSFTTPENCYYIRFTFRTNTDINILQLTEGTEAKPYVPYGNNYVNVAVSDGTNTNNYPIPLNNNEIVGIGDYKDELKVDKSGHVSIEKNTAKIDSYNGEIITTPYMSTTGGLDTGATVYYGIDTPQLIDLQTTVDLSLFKGVNNVSNSEDGYMTIEYK